MSDQRVCENCKKAPATDAWAGHHDATSLARNPSLIQRWCHQCVLVAQVEHWRKLVPLLAEAERELAELVGAAALRSQSEEQENDARSDHPSPIEPLTHASVTETAE